jgi:monoamine oxidase
MSAADVVVLGAGVAGLAAAERLGATGRRVLVLEARDRVGGRIHTVDDPGLAYPVELGAEFIHGRPPELLELIRELGLTLEAVPPRTLPNELVGTAPLSDIRSSLATLLRGDTGPDRPVADLVRERGSLLGRPGELQAVVQYLESFHAADLGRLGTRTLAENELAEDVQGDELHRVREGYGALVRRLAARCSGAGVVIRLGAAATGLAWRPGQVRVMVSNQDGRAEEVSARRAVVALPLPVLKRLVGADGTATLEPVPPPWGHALATLHMGPAHRVVLGFDARWWAPDGGDGPGFVRGDREAFPVWWTALPSRAPVLTGWVGGPRAAALTGRGEAVLLRAALDSLASVFGRDVGELRSRSRLAYGHDWSADSWTGGAYSYGGVGAGEARVSLGRPIEDTLFLAGEALAGSGENATVHGALASGRRAARQVLEAA